MEAPSLIVMLWLYAAGANTGWVPKIALFLWASHYAYRSFLYPALARLDGKTMPVVVAALAVVFNLGNAGFNGLTLFCWLPDSTVGINELGGVQILGLVFFLTGFFVHVHSDHVLRGLRKDGERGYKIPGKGLHCWVASPNYFGEIVQWLGFALFVQNLAGWSFLLWTVANLLPRALVNHQWYKETFSDYPKERKALVPLVF
jgi:3-oxo-5-alpha-steroid 4-dehydrogenase 1